ncbi:MAG: LysM peptidoglycan-binding domain-containing protein [Desulfobacteraceae bacterium]
MQLPWSRHLLLVLSLLFFSSCASQTSYKFLEKETILGEEGGSAEEPTQAAEASVSEDNDSETVKEDSQSSSVKPTDPSGSPKMLTQTYAQQASPKFKVTPHPLSPKSLVMTNQELVDSALEFCETSNDYWEQGDLDNAIDALDKAYSLILKVSGDAEPELLQQKEDLRITISRRIVEVYVSRFTAANGDHKVIPLVMNRHVERALALFKGREREFFLASYRRSGKYRPEIVKFLEEAGLPEELSWLPLIESGFKIRAMSRARALGLWQFIASTGYKFGLKRNMWIDERMDAEKSTKAAIAYLKELHQIFGDWATVLAAYNCGERRVLNRIKSQRINYLDNFWDLYERLPRETAFYVPKFLAVLHILNDPEAHGFTLPPVDEELRAEKVDINKQVHLKTIARRLDIDYGTLKELNPELRHHLTPSEPYVLKVPPGKGEVLLAKLDDIPVWRPPVPAYVVHRVRYGESLSVIADKYGTSTRAIMNMNGLRRRDYLKVGWKLRIPVKKTRFTHLARPPIQTSQLKGEMVEYTVQKGDSLWLIARRFGTTTRMIRSLNQLNTSVLRVGQVLKISPGRMVMKLDSTQTHLVREGDSPYLIAKKYEIDLSEFLKINNLTPRSTIFPGEIVTIKAK